MFVFVFNLIISFYTRCHKPGVTNGFVSVLTVIENSRGSDDRLVLLTTLHL